MAPTETSTATPASVAEVLEALQTAAAERETPELETPAATPTPEPTEAAEATSPPESVGCVPPDVSAGATELETRIKPYITRTATVIYGEVVNGSAAVADVVVVLCTADTGPAVLFPILGVLEPEGVAPFYFQTEPLRAGSFEVAAYAVPVAEAVPANLGFELIVQEQSLQIVEAASSDQPPAAVVDFRALNDTAATAVDLRVWITFYDPSGAIISVLPIDLEQFEEVDPVDPGGQIGSTITISLAAPLPEGSTVGVRVVGFAAPVEGEWTDVPTPLEQDAASRAVPGVRG